VQVAILHSFIWLNSLVF